MDTRKFELPADGLWFGFPEHEVKRLEGADWGKEVIGQPRALEALKMGAAIKSKGYNVFVSGAPGTGRRTAALAVLSRTPVDRAALRDAAYVFDFRKPLAPKALYFEPGKGREFKKDLHSLVENLKRVVKLQVESEGFRKRRDEIVRGVEDAENGMLSDFEAELARSGFQAVQAAQEDGSTSTEIVPTVDGKPTTFDELQTLVASGAMTQDEWNSKRQRYYDYMDRLKKLFERLRSNRASMESELEEQRDAELKPVVSREIGLLRELYKDEKVEKWLRDLERDVLQHVHAFIGEGEAEAEEGKKKGHRHLSRYGANVVVDCAEIGESHVVVENHPTVANLFGSVETDGHDSKPGYLRIRAGSLAHASGGFLVLKAEDALGEDEVWPNLKRALRSGKVEIQNQSGHFPPQQIVKPEPLEIGAKVVMIGGEMAYDALYQADPDFQKLFKVSAEFDSTMSRTDEAMREYIAFVRKIAREEGLPEPDRSGIATIIEHGVRLSEYRDRLSTRFGAIADLIRESAYAARSAGKPAIDAASVREASARRAYLSSLPEEKLGEMIVSGEIILDVAGKQIGRVNGLAVHDRGYYSFGLPAVISAQVSPGGSGVVNIEGESGLSGEIYDKAVLIVEGFLRSRYAREFPLSVTASICFEQSYNAVEGDSASSTAVYALLSAIAGVPLRQDVAVTGSLNQMGSIQPVGGISDKIEGFFKICKHVGFTGTQGVMIPKQNVVNLTLSADVIQAVRDGKFRIWAVSSIDEGLEVLSGIESGKPRPDGSYPEGSFNGRVSDELLAMARTVHEYTS
jgi:lon-related putative ATP-dependent protease